MKILYLGVVALISLSCANSQDKLIQATSTLLSGVSIKNTLAVLPLESRLEQDSLVGRTISEVIVSVASAQGFNLVERAAFAEIVKEQQLAVSGLTHDSSAIRVGELLSAKNLITGSVAEFLGDKLITLKLLDTETGEVLNSQTIKMKPSGLSEIQKELFGESTQVTAVVFRSALIPGWGQIYAGKSVRGGIWLTSFLGSLGLVGYGFHQSNKAYDEYIKIKGIINHGDSNLDKINMVKACGSSCGTPEEINNPKLNSFIELQASNQFESYTGEKNRLNIYLALSGVIWTANLIDAYFVAIERKEKMNLYFTALPTFDGGVDFKIALQF